MSPVQGPSASSITSEKVYASVREANEAFLKPAEEIWGSIIGQLLFVGEYQEVGRHLHRSVVLRSTFHYIFGSNHTAIVYNSLKNHPAIHFKKSKRLTVEVDSIRAPLNLPLDDLKQQPDYSPNLAVSSHHVDFSMLASQRIANMNTKIQQSLKISCFPFTSLDTSKLQEPELIPKTTKQKTLPISHTASSFEETCEAMTISELENAIQNHQAMALLDRHHHESQKELSDAKTILTEQIQCLEEMLEFRVCERESVPVSSKPTSTWLTLNVQLPAFMVLNEGELIKLKEVWRAFEIQPRICASSLKPCVLSVVLIFLARLQQLKTRGLTHCTMGPILIVTPFPDRWIALFRVVVPIKELQEVMGGLFLLRKGISKMASDI